MSRFSPESSILKPRDPALDENTDEWPEFVLSNAHVHLPGDPNATTSLLEASAGYPLTVTGQLEPLDDEDAHLYLQQPTKKRINVVLEKVCSFSYGQYGDGSTALWAAGKSGWFTIKPGRGYRPFYEAMEEAVSLLYFIADAYREPRKKGRGASATILPDYTAAEIYGKYAKEELGSDDPADGEAMIYLHKEFLIMCMLSGRERLGWSKYPLTKKLKREFPDITAEIKRRLESSIPNDDDKPARSKGSKAKQTRQGSIDTNASTSNSKRKRGQTRNKTVNVITIDSDSEDSEAMQELVQAAAREHYGVSAKGAPHRSRSTRQHSMKEPVEEDLATPTKDDETDEETRLRGRKNKSSLRPKASKGSKSSARKGGKGLTNGETDDDDDETLSSPIAGKRKYDDGMEIRRPSKQRSSKTHPDEGIDIPTSPSASGDAEDDSSNEALGGTADLPLRNFGHVADPIQEDTYICALDGCAHKVYAASHPDSQRLIKAHYALHAYDDDERVQLVKKLQAPSMPAGHLMERVKQQAKMEGFPGSRQLASRYPMTMPIVQKY